MTRYAFSSHTYPDEPEKWLKPPVGKYLEIIKCAMEPSDEIKQIDLCCGLGFGKTLLAIQIAVLKLRYTKGAKILFLEPDWDRIDTIFLDTWEKHVPPELYIHERGHRKIIWKRTGATLYYRARIISGAKSAAQDKRRGPQYTDVIDDETAIGFDLIQYQNTFARIREPSDSKTYITLTTPQVGAYGRFLKRGGNIIFQGRTADNHYLLAVQPDYETKLRAVMSADQARRELDGELIALEGRIWKTALPSIPWPAGNRNDIHRKFDPEKPWWLFCDFGSATGAYAVVQQMDSVYNGRELYKNNPGVWVAVADLCPTNDADASRAFQQLKLEFGFPAGVVGGLDINTRNRVDGTTVAFFAQQVWSNVQLYVCNETLYHKRIQYNRMNYLMCSAQGDRRFTIAKDFVSLEPDSHRGVREMVDEDQWPPMDKRRAGDFLPKNNNITVQHIRDALLMGAVEVMARPDWHYQDDPPR